MNHDTLMEFRDFVHSQLEYIDGHLHWKKTAKTMTMRGKKAGSIEAKGYYVVSLCGKVYKMHRLIFLMHYGHLPTIVDHINGDKLDNRIENLRQANHSQNTNNSGARKNNKSGFKGVSQIGSGKWQAAIRTTEKRLYLGVYETPELAHQAYVDAAKIHHKEFARFV